MALAQAPTQNSKTAEPILGRFRRLGMSSAWPVLFALVVVILFFRQPSAIRHPSFVAEDGNIFFKQQYEMGYKKSLFTHYAGYLHCIPRTVAALCSNLPIEQVPAGYSVVSLLLAAVALTFFFAPGFRPVIDSDLVRAIVVLTFTVMPNADSLMRLAYLCWYAVFFTSLLTIFTLPKKKALRWLLFVPALMAVWSAPLTIVCLPVLLLRAYLAKENDERAWWGALALAIIGFSLSTDGGGSLMMTALRQPGWPPALLHAISYRCFDYFFLGETVAHPLPENGWAGATRLGLLLAAIGAVGASLAFGRFRKRDEKSNAPLILFYLIIGGPMLFILRMEIVPDFLGWNERTWLWHQRYFFTSTLLLCVLGGIVFETLLRNSIFLTKRARMIGAVFLIGWLSLHTLTFRLWDWRSGHSWKHYAREIRAVEGEPQPRGTNTVHIETSVSAFDFDLKVH